MGLKEGRSVLASDFAAPPRAPLPRCCLGATIAAPSDPSQPRRHHGQITCLGAGVLHACGVGATLSGACITLKPGTLLAKAAGVQEGAGGEAECRVQEGD